MTTPDYTNLPADPALCPYCGQDEVAHITGASDACGGPEARPVEEVVCPACGGSPAEHMIYDGSGSIDWRCLDEFRPRRLYDDA